MGASSRDVAYVVGRDPTKSLATGFPSSSIAKDESDESIDWSPCEEKRCDGSRESKEMSEIESRGR